MKTLQWKKWLQKLGGVVCIQRSYVCVAFSLIFPLHIDITWTISTFSSCDAHRNSIDEENKMSFVTKDISIEININNPRN